MDSEAPSRSLSQRMDALEKANKIRGFRSALKKEIKAGHRDLIELLLNPPSEIETMKVFELMKATPRLGRVKVNKMLVQARVSPSKTIGGLSERQQNELLHLLRRRP